MTLPTIVTINGVTYLIEEDPITYETVVTKAGHRADDIVSVTWYHRDGKYRHSSGILAPGETVERIPGMIFNAYITGGA